MTVHDLRLGYAQFIKETYHPKLVYYPACGADTVPKTIFGENNVVHLSLPSDDQTQDSYNYFQLLGDGIKLYGNMDESPLAENSVDLIWLKLESITPTSKAISDFYRVLKTSGYVYLEEYHLYQIEKWQHLIHLFSSFTNVTPDSIQINPPIYTVTPNEYANNPKSLEEYEKNSLICKNESEMMDIVTSQHLHFGKEIIPRQAVFQKKD